MKSIAGMFNGEINDNYILFLKKDALDTQGVHIYSGT